MHKLSLLLIPLLFLSSCTIDWNDEKDKKIAELEWKIETLQMENLQLLDSTRSLTLSWNICDIRLNECLTRSWIKSSDWDIKDFWSSFILSQTDNETIISYSGKTIKTWSHTPPKEVPFVWDEGCKELLAIFDETRKNNINPDNYSWKQKAWDLLSTTKKKTCIADNLSHNIHTESISPRFFSIIQSHYEWAESDFFDSISWRILFHIDAGIAGNAYIENNNLYILVNGVYAANEIYTYSFVEKRILKKEVIQDARYEEVLQQFKNHN